jgi:N-acetylneuraminic acid mutarotase
VNQKSNEIKEKNSDILRRIKMDIQKITHNKKQNFNWILAGLIFSSLMKIPSVSLGAGDIWMQKTDMPTDRLWHTSNVVDGKIYAIGGRATETLTTEYEPLTDTWTTKTPMPTARFAHSTSVVDGKIYAIGGVTAAGTSGLSIVEEYDPVTDSWTSKAPMPTARFGLATSVVDGKIYAIGGTGSSSFWADFRRTVEVYDPLTDTWSKKADMPTARAFFSTNAVDGKIYAIGGVLVTKAGLSTVEVYDPVTDTWTAKTPMPTARHVHASAVVDGKIYVIGGGPEGGANHAGPDGLSVVEAYDPAMDTWTTKADIPEPRGLLSASAVGGKIYAIGGKTTTKDPHPPGLSTVYVYDTGFTVASPDFNGDGTVDIKDLLRLIESWGQDDPLCDIASPLYSDGIIDAMDLELLMNYWEQPVDDHTLIAHWALNEAEGTVAYDSAGVNDASVIGEPVWRPEGGKVGGALALDGIDDCAFSQCCLNPAAGAFSVFVWIQGGAPGQVVISQLDGTNWLCLDPSWGCLTTNLCYSGRAGSPLQSEILITDGNWHRIGFVWDGLYRTLYIDDILVAEDTQKGLGSSIGGLNIGCGSNSAAGTFWSGLIDDIRIYNRVVIP